MRLFKNIKVSGWLVALVIIVAPLSARADLTGDLQSLVTQGSVINNNLSLFSFADQSCSDLVLVNREVKGFVTSAETVTANLTAPLSISVEDMDSLDALSGLAKEMAISSMRLSLEIQDIENSAERFEYQAALNAMLELSDDIGSMADRILEMADRILAMADNIGTMAERILITQQIQSANMALTQASLLTTQQNMILMSNSVSSIIYNLTLNQIVSDSNTLLDEMAMVSLTSENMAQELESLNDNITLLSSDVVALYTWMSSNSQDASHDIDVDTLSLLADLANIYSEQAFFLEIYATSINQLAPATDTVILADATAAMLRLSADIGLMAERINEMGDKIIIMADNIGLMADNIIASQELQQTNSELTESSLLAVQSVTITVIKDMNF